VWVLEVEIVAAAGIAETELAQTGASVTLHRLPVFFAAEVWSVFQWNQALKMLTRVPGVL